MDPSRFLLALRHPIAKSMDEARRAFLADYAVIADANDCAVTFDADGFLYTDQEAIGRYCFVAVEEVAATFAEATWLRLGAPDPSLGPVRAFMGFDLWEEHRDRVANLLKVWSCAAAGYLVVTEHGTAYDAIRTFTFPLVHALWGAGFDDGDHFLRDNERYMQRIRDIVGEALEEHGVVASLITYDTHHNPIQFRTTALDAEKRLANCEVSFPAFDFQMFHEERLLMAFGVARRASEEA